MKKIIFSAVCFSFIFFACGEKKLSPDMKKQEIAAIEARIDEMIKSYNSLDEKGIEGLISNSADAFFYGTDSAEVMNSKEDFMKFTRIDFSFVEKYNFMPVTEKHISISDYGDMAASWFQVPLEMTILGKVNTGKVRFAFVWIKEDGKWVVQHSMPQIPSKGHSSYDVKKMVDEAKKKKK